MSTATTSDPQFDRFGSGFAGAILLHAAIVAAIVGWAFVEHLHHPDFGESSATAGSIQASMVSAIPLPPKATPVEKSVLASEDTEKVPAPQPKETTIPPPKPDDILLKSKTPDKTITKTAPTPTTAVKHPQPTPDTPEASTGEQATQLPQSIVQTTDGTATITVQNRALGERYAWYIRLVGSKVQQSYSQQFKDPRTSLGKSVTILFFIDNNGAPTNIQLQASSGSPSLDNAGKRALQEIDTFGPNPANQPIPIALQFVYQHQ
jgi:periplasmic protein TonB